MSQTVYRDDGNRTVRALNGRTLESRTPEGSSPACPAAHPQGASPLLQGLGDILALAFCLTLGWAAPAILPGLAAPAPASERLLAVAAGMAILPLWYAFLGLYRSAGMSPVERFRRRFGATAITFVTLFVTMAAMAPTPGDLTLLTVAMLTALVVVPGMDLARRSLLANRTRHPPVPVEVIGQPEFRAHVGRLLNAVPEFGLAPAAAPKCDGPVSPIPRASAYVIEPPRMPPATRTAVWDVGGMAGVVGIGQDSSRVDRLLKAAMDKAVAAVALPLALPLLLGAGLALWLASPGPVFYCQTRVGQYGRPIRVWKLRTMRVDAERRLQEHLAADPDAQEEWNTFCKLKRDPRVIPVVGTFLRRTSLDELPQLWNVLNGTMSLVGPRPFPDYHMEMFPEPFRALRVTVPPGLTGLWQVSARSDGDLGVQETLDTHYIRNWSVWLDLYILFKTPLALMAKRGAY